jgi:hypothetical protein
MESSNLRRVIVYGVAGLATAAIGATTVNSIVSDADQPEAQKTGQSSPTPGTAPATVPPPAPAPAPATQLQVRPAPAAQQAKPAAAPAVELPVKPPVKRPVKPAVKPVMKTKIKPVTLRKTTQAKKKPVVLASAVTVPAPKPATVDLSLPKALANVGQAQAAVKRAEAGLAEAKKNLRLAKSKLDKTRQRIATGRHKAITTVTGVKVSKDMAKRLTHHRSVHAKAKPGQTLKISVSSSSSTG